MTRIVLDAEMLNKLNELKMPLELCDSNGHILARVMPVRDVATYVGTEPRISEEEREERRNYKGPMHTTAEVLKRLEEL